MHVLQAILDIFVHFFIGWYHPAEAVVYTPMCARTRQALLYLGKLKKHVLIVTSNMSLNLVFFFLSCASISEYGNNDLFCYLTNGHHALNLLAKMFYAKKENVVN